MYTESHSLGTRSPREEDFNINERDTFDCCCRLPKKLSINYLFLLQKKHLEPASFAEGKSKTKLALALNYIDFVLFLFIFVFVFFGAATHIWVPSLETSQQQTHSEQLRCRRQNTHTHLPMRRDNWRRLKSYDFKEEKLPKVGESCVCCLGYPQNKMAAASNSNSCFSSSKTRLIHTSLQQFWW